MVVAARVDEAAPLAAGAEELRLDGLARADGLTLLSPAELAAPVAEALFDLSLATRLRCWSSRRC